MSALNLKMYFCAWCIVLFIISDSRCEVKNSIIKVPNNETLDFRISNDTQNIQVCCLPDQGLMRTSLGGGMFQYECVEPYQDEREGLFNVTLEVPLASLYVANIEYFVQHGFPDGCKESDLIEIPMSSVKAMPREYCVDKLIVEKVNNTYKVGDDSLVVLSCDPLKANKFNIPSYRSIQKCCVGDMVYDTDNHTCVNTASTNKSSEPYKNLDFLNPLFDDDILLFNVHYGFPSCLSPKIAYEYSDDDYDFELSEIRIKMIGAKRELEFVSGSFCIDRSTKDSLIVRTCGAAVRSYPFVTKCCPEGQVFMYPNNTCGGRAACAANPNWGFSPTFFDISNKDHPVHVSPPKTIGIQYTPQCPQGKYMHNKNDASYLDEATGHLLIPSLAANPMQPDYCLEILDSPCPNRPAELYTFICFPVVADPVKMKTKLQTFSIGLIISCVFLAATLVVYLALPALQNLHGRTLMSHVASMLVAYSCLARVQASSVPKNYCKVLGYAVYFSFLAAFSWLNIMCFDIWWTFGNIRAVRGMHHDKDRKKFFMFSLYAWGVPLILTTVTLLLDEYDVARGILDPNIGHSQCWFSSNTFKWPVLILFIMPVGIQIGTNLVLFTLTAIHCNKVKSEIHRMQAGSMGDRCKRRFMADKAKYAMNMKLFVVMGITWVTEIISSFYNEPYELWYVADAINVLQGIPIFCILVLKKKVYRLIRKRLGLDKMKRETFGGTTTTTGISTNSCTDPLSRKYNSQISSSSIKTNLNGKPDAHL